MNIVVLDGFTLNPGDQDWNALRALGECEIHDRTDPADLLARALPAQILLTNKTQLPRAVLEQLPELRYIGVLATGFNVVDVATARERGIPVTNVPAYSTRSVAQFTWALILELAHRIGVHAASVDQGDWARCPDFCYWKSPLVELEGRTLGVVGMGHIGRAVADLGLAFGMRVVAATRSRLPASAARVESLPLRELFERSDVISLHCPLTEETRGLINAERIAWMKPGAWLINTSRGPLLDEPAVAEALRSGRIGAAALDVLSVEPPAADHPLMGLSNCLITPHIAWATLASRRRLMRIAVENVKGFLSGTPVNVVS